MTKAEAAKKIYEHLMEIQCVMDQVDEECLLHFSSTIIQHKKKGNYLHFSISETGKPNSWKLIYDNVTSDRDRGVYYSEDFVEDNVE